MLIFVLHTGKNSRCRRARGERETGGWSGVRRIVSGNLGGGYTERARTFGSGFFGGAENRSSLSTPRNFSPGTSTGYTLVRQPKQMSSFGWRRARTSPVMLRYPRESAPTNFETSST